MYVYLLHFSLLQNVNVMVVPVAMIDQVEVVVILVGTIMVVEHHLIPTATLLTHPKLTLTMAPVVAPTIPILTPATHSQPLPLTVATKLLLIRVTTVLELLITVPGLQAEEYYQPHQTVPRIQLIPTLCTQQLQQLL